MDKKDNVDIELIISIVSMFMSICALILSLKR